MLPPKLVAITLMGCAFVLFQYIMIAQFFTRGGDREVLKAAFPSSNDVVSLGNFVEIPEVKERRNLFLSSSSTASSWNPLNPLEMTYLWDVFEPSVVCGDVERVGKLGDGGKYTCGLTRLSKSTTTDQESTKCTIYSFGIGVEVTWDEEMMKRFPFCVMHMFDPSVGEIPSSFLSNQLSTPHVTFHKKALSSDSTRHEDFLVSDHLFSIMDGLGDEYIDILKLDIEGGEWEVFEKICHQFSLVKDRKTTTIPIFGQLLIELHHSHWNQTLPFFQCMEDMGYHIFSREINLNPTVSRNLPTAAEYSFIHPFFFFSFDNSNIKKGWSSNLIKESHSKQQHQYKKNQAASLRREDDRIKGCIYVLTQKKRRNLLISMLQDFSKYFSKQFHQYPIIVFHDDLDKLDQEMIISSLPTYLNLKFVFKPFPEIPKSIDPSTIPKRTKCSYETSTIGYRQMCRFHAFGALDHLMDEGYDWFWRVDDDSIFSAPIGYDPFDLMRGNDWKYGFNSIVTDGLECVEGMWEMGYQVSRDLETSLNEDISPLFYQWTKGEVFYNNFEISHKSVWLNKIYERWREEVEKSGRIFTHRWGDAPIHTVGVTMALKSEEIHRFSDIGYSHLPFLNQISSSLPHPKAIPFFDDFAVLNDFSSFCHYAYNHWECGNQSSNSTLASGNSIMNFVKNNDDEEGDVEETKKDRIFGATFYSFYQTQTRKSMKQAIQSYYDHFNKDYHYPIQLFYDSQEEGFSIKDETLFLVEESTIPASIIHFYPVELPTFQDIKEKFQTVSQEIQCAGEDYPLSTFKERAIYHFLSIKVHDLLSWMGFHWFWRFDDSSRIMEPIPYDPFNQMLFGNTKYVWIGIVKDAPKCVEGVWELGGKIVKDLMDHGSEISPLFYQWTKGEVFYNNFEISHKSVWLNKIYERWREEVEKSGRIFTHRWGDAPIHTVGVTMALKSEEIHRFSDIAYVNKPLYQSFVTPPPISNHIANLDVSVESFGSSISSFLKPIGDVKNSFIGGDIVSTIPFPSNDNCETLIWLFGDTMIGDIQAGERINFETIDNSIGISKCIDLLENSGNVKESIHYFWDEKGGKHSPIFEPNMNHLKSLFPIKTKSTSIFSWPLSGVFLPGKQIKNGKDQKKTKDEQIEKTRIVILSQTGERVPRNKESKSNKADQFRFSSDASKRRESTLGLEFEGLYSELVIIPNPHELPTWWNMSQTILLPSSISTNGPASQIQLEWSSIFLGQQKMIRIQDSYLYLVGFMVHENGERFQFMSRISCNDLLKEEEGDHKSSKVQIEMLLEEGSVVSNQWMSINQISSLNFNTDPQQKLVPISPLFSPPTHEISIVFVPMLDVYASLKIHYLKTHFDLCIFNPSTMSKWDCKPLFAPSDEYWNVHRYLIYTPKLHPELSSPSTSCFQSQRKVAAEELAKEKEEKDIPKPLHCSIPLSFVVTCVNERECPNGPTSNQLYWPEFRLLTISNRVANYD